MKTQLGNKRCPRQPPDQGRVKIRRKWGQAWGMPSARLVKNHARRIIQRESERFSGLPMGQRLLGGGGKDLILPVVERRAAWGGRI